MQHFFDKEIYTSRRNILQQKVGSGIILLLGNDESGMSYAGNVYPFRQDSSFLYYIGIDQPALTAIIDVEANNTILFGDELTIDDIVWTGPLPPLTDTAAHTGILTVKPANEVAVYLKKAIEKGQQVHYLPPYRAEHTLKLQQWLQVQAAQVATGKSVTLIKAIVAMRSYKENFEVAEIEKAVDISTAMHKTAMLLATQPVTEAHIAGAITGMAISAGGNISFPPIVTTNGETLHIHAQNRPVYKDKLLLCDAGAETGMHYAGDLTRTVPVNGKFTALQKHMYNTVLNAQLAAIAACKPGVLYKDVHTIAAEKLLEGLKEAGIVTGDIKEAVANDVHTLFFQCGLGHMMGLDVHDMENLGEPYVGYSETIIKGTSFGWKSLRLGRELEPGFVVTVEPGLYFIPTLMNLWKAENKLSSFINYTELDKLRQFGGIRIEDDVLITEAGHRVLGNEMAPKTVADIEAFLLS